MLDEKGLTAVLDWEFAAGLTRFVSMKPLEMAECEQISDDRVNPKRVSIEPSSLC